MLSARILIFLGILIHFSPSAGQAQTDINSRTETISGEPSSGIINTLFTESISPRTTQGLLIDGGSGGSRLHIYQWSPRVFQTVPPPISFPTKTEQYSAKMSGGVQSCWQPGLTKFELRQRVAAHFQPMLNFAKAQLTEFDDRIPHIPIWFKATGGARVSIIHTTFISTIKLSA